MIVRNTPLKMHGRVRLLKGFRYIGRNLWSCLLYHRVWLLVYKIRKNSVIIWLHAFQKYRASLFWIKDGGIWSQNALVQIFVSRSLWNARGTMAPMCRDKNYSTIQGTTYTNQALFVIIDGCYNNILVLCRNKLFFNIHPWPWRQATDIFSRSFVKVTAIGSI